MRWLLPHIHRRQPNRPASVCAIPSYAKATPPGQHPRPPRAVPAASRSARLKRGPRRARRQAHAMREGVRLRTRGPRPPRRPPAIVPKTASQYVTVPGLSASQAPAKASFPSRAPLRKRKGPVATCATGPVCLATGCPKRALLPPAPPERPPAVPKARDTESTTRSRVLCRRRASRSQDRLRARRTRRA
jgi:hypothetical protein